MQTVWANVHVHVERGFGASNLGLLGLRKTHPTHDDDSKRHSRYVWQCILTTLTTRYVVITSGKLHQPKKEEAASAEEGGSCISRRRRKLLHQPACSFPCASATLPDLLPLEQLLLPPCWSPRSRRSVTTTFLMRVLRLCCGSAVQTDVAEEPSRPTRGEFI